MQTMKLFLLLAAGWGTFWLTGCVTSLDGRHHAGVPFVKDKVEARYERPAQEVLTAAQDVLNYNGKLYSKDELKSTLEASVNQRTVWVRVEQVDEKTTKVTVQARTRAGGTDMELAGEIDKQIAVRLASGNLTPFTSKQSGNY
jgi:hypothetical protein